MRTALHYLIGVKRSVRRWLPQPHAGLPDFHQMGLLRQFHAAGADDGKGGLETAAVAFFGRGATRAGFFAPDEALEAAAAYAAGKPDWRDTLLKEAARTSQKGLPVYGTTVGPLQGGLDWSALPRDRHNDRLYQLRPHRFGFLPRLAMAAALDAETLPALRETLERWMTHVENGRGRANAYFSNLLVIYRLLAITWAAPIVAGMAGRGGRTAAIVCLRMFQILAADIGYLQPRFGQSVSNNHLLADRFADWFAVACFPELHPQADRQALEQGWLDELFRQFQVDGTNFEQSVHYHELGCEMALSYLVVALRRGEPPAEEALRLIREMLRFQAALSDAKGNSFALGDATDDPLLPLDAGGGWAPGAWRILYRVLFDDGFPATDERAQGAERAHWLLASLASVDKPLRLAPSPQPLGCLAAFPQGGYFVLQDEYQAQRVLFRTGPQQGVRVRPGHAMSDLLSVYWSASGCPLLEASGTYSYAGDVGQIDAGPKRARSYFIGPAAHNGAVLKEHDPWGVPQGRFRGDDNGTRVASRWGGVPGVLSWVESRLSESGPLDGYRRGLLQIAGHYLLVYDRLPDLPEDAVATFHWQWAPEARIAVHTVKQASIMVNGLAAYLCGGPGLASMEVLRGQGDPPAGWVSRRYGLLEAAPQLICTADGSARIHAFVLGLAGEGADLGGELPSIEVLSAGVDSLVLEIRHGHQHGIACIGDFTGRPRDLSIDITFQGRALWLDLQGDSCREIRALGLKRLCSATLGLDLRDNATPAAAGGREPLSTWGTETSGLCGRWELGSDG